jgi:hypothetical protein
MQAIKLLNRFSQHLRAEMTALNLCRFAAASTAAVWALEASRSAEGLKQDPFNHRVKVTRSVASQLVLYNLALHAFVYRFHPAAATVPLGLLGLGSYATRDVETNAEVLLGWMAVTTTLGGLISIYIAAQSVAALTARAGKIISWGSGLGAAVMYLVLVGAGTHQVDQALVDTDAENKAPQIFEALFGENKSDKD